MFHKKIDEHINKTLEDLKLEKPIALQKKTISSIKSGMDTLVISETETGKSTALVIGVIQKLKTALNDVPRALIIVPDKTKADALKLKFDEIGQGTNLRTFTVYSGPNLQKLKDQIYFGSDVIIGTTKRLNELYSNNGLNLNDLQLFVIDDAQESIKAEHTSYLDRLFEIIPDAQHIILSENLGDRIVRFAEKYLTRPNILKAE